MRESKFICAGIVAVSLLALASAYTAEYVFGLKPCILCLIQRVPYAITTVLGLIGLIAVIKFKKEQAAQWIIILSGITFATGTIIAFYHSGVEQHWWKSFLEGCSSGFGKVNSPDALLAMIEGTAAVPCDKIPWADPIFGLSMAAYNTMMSAGLAAGCFLGAYNCRSSVSQ